MTNPSSSAPEDAKGSGRTAAGQKVGVRAEIRDETVREGLARSRGHDPQSHKRQWGFSHSYSPVEDSEQLPAGRLAGFDQSWRPNISTLHKPTLKGTARIWFYVDGSTVYLEQVHTAHPNETK